MKILDMLKSKDKGEKESTDNTPKYGELAIREQLDKYIKSDEVVDALIPAFQQLSKSQPDGGLVEDILSVFEYQNQRIETFSNENHTSVEDNDDSEVTEVNMRDDDTDDDASNQNLVDQILAAKYQSQNV